MRCNRLLFCLFGLSVAFFVVAAQARSARRLKGEGIRGGENADEADYPYQISFQILNQSICGGSILDERYAITAAHCVVGKDGKLITYPMTVLAGVNDLNSTSKNRVVVDVIEVFVPKEYDPTYLLRRTSGDIAILKLQTNLGIKSNPNLGKVKLPEEDETYANVTATITGFGWNQVNITYKPFLGVVESGTTDKKLRYAEAKVLAHDDCRKTLINPIMANHVCAKVVQREKFKLEGVCSGDSGGPLVYKGAQIGVLSSSPFACREDSEPAVYTRVSKYLDFIKKVVSGKIDSSIRTTTLTNDI